MALFKPFLSLPLLVAQPERGDSLAPTSNLLPPCGAQRPSCPTLTARAKAFGRLLPPKPCRSFVPYARCCPVSSFSIRKARQRARHKHPSTHGEAPLSKPPRSPNSHPKWSRNPTHRWKRNSTPSHEPNPTKPDHEGRSFPTEPRCDPTPNGMFWSPEPFSRKVFLGRSPRVDEGYPPPRKTRT